MELLRINANRKRPGANLASKSGHDPAPDAASGGPPHVFVETCQVFGRLEAQQVIFEERPQNPFVLRQRAQDLRRREWRVQEKADPLTDMEPAQFRSQRKQVEIVDPYAVRWPQDPVQRPAETGVDLLI